jgi:hypothetical protein
MLIKVERYTYRGSRRTRASIHHKHNIHSVLKEGRKTNWTWDKTVED